LEDLQQQEDASRVTFHKCHNQSRGLCTHKTKHTCGIGMAGVEPLAAGKRKQLSLPEGPEEAPTLASGDADCDDDEIKFGGEGDTPTAPQKWHGGGTGPPWTVEEHALLLQVRKQYDAGEITSCVAFTQAASDALGGKRTPIACQRRYIKLRPEPQPGIARPKRIKLDANAAVDCDDAGGDEGGAAAVARTCIPWSPDEDFVLRRLVDRWHANQFASARRFYDEAVKQLAGRTAGAIETRLRILERW
jgi:hypothetical protein